MGTKRICGRLKTTVTLPSVSHASLLNQLEMEKAKQDEDEGGDKDKSKKLYEEEPKIWKT